VRSVFFCNEMLGLGHLRLSLAIAQALVASSDELTALIVTGSPAFGGMRVPERVDVLKLPTLPVGAYSPWNTTGLRPPTHLAMSPDEVLKLRSQLSLAAVAELRPSIAVVDYRPLGRHNELRPALDHLRRQGDCTIALGLWDVDDAAAQLRRDWPEDVFAEVRELYDLALVYGPSSAADVRIDGLRAAGVPVHHTDLVAAPAAARGPADLREPYLLATTGGGVDGFALLDAFVQALRLRPLGLPALVVTGPMMAADQVDHLRTSAAGLDVRIEQFRPDMDAVLAGARAVVSMAGYNAVAEVLASGKPALLVPRTSPREEQLNRARGLAAAGRVEMLDPSALEPARLSRVIQGLLDRPPVAPKTPTGARDAARILLNSRGG
jgi:predicted glycosyltransferase